MNLEIVDTLQTFSPHRFNENDCDLCAKDTHFSHIFHGNDTISKKSLVTSSTGDDLNINQFQLSELAALKIKRTTVKIIILN